MWVLQLAHLKVAHLKPAAFWPQICHWFRYPVWHSCPLSAIGLDELSWSWTQIWSYMPDYDLNWETKVSVLQLARLKIVQLKQEAFRPQICHWFRYPIWHKCQTAQLKPGKKSSHQQLLVQFNSVRISWPWSLKTLKFSLQLSFILLHKRRLEAMFWPFWIIFWDHLISLDITHKINLSAKLTLLVGASNTLTVSSADK